MPQDSPEVVSLQSTGVLIDLVGAKRGIGLVRPEVEGTTPRYLEYFPFLNHVVKDLEDLITPEGVQL